MSILSLKPVPVTFGARGQDHHLRIASNTFIDTIGLEIPVQNRRLDITDPLDLLFTAAFKKSLQSGARARIDEDIERRCAKVKPKVQPAAVLKEGIAGRDGGED